MDLEFVEEHGVHTVNRNGAKAHPLDGRGRVLAYFKAEPNFENGEAPDWMCWDVGAAAGGVQLLKDLPRYGRPEMMAMSGTPVTWHDAESWGLTDATASLQVIDGERFLLSDYSGVYATGLCSVSAFLAVLEALPPGQDVVLVEDRLEAGFEGPEGLLAGNWKRVPFSRS